MAGIDCNDTSGLNGLLLLPIVVFEVVLRTAFRPDKLSKQREKMQALHNVCAQMASLTTTVQLQKEVNRCTLYLADVDIKIEDAVLVFWNQPTRWMSPHCVISNNKNVIHVKNDSCIGQHSMDQCKHYAMEGEIQELMRAEIALLNQPHAMK